MSLKTRPVHVVRAPTNLGLRPPDPGREPGAWQAPQVLEEASLGRAVGAHSVSCLTKPAYSPDAPTDSRIRNGPAIRAFSLDIAQAVENSIHRGEFPLVIGGDCSILLGAMLGARRASGRGLIHIDGHSDFFHPDNYDTAARLGSVAGMDLALATGRGERLLTDWPDVPGPLADDTDTFQFGERDEFTPGWAAAYSDIALTKISRLNIHDIKAIGVPAAASRLLAWLDARDLHNAWLHLDLDVLDQSELPAVDSPGTPGLSFQELSYVLQFLLASGRLIGMNVSIYDPDLDPDRRHARRIVDCLGIAFQAAMRQ